MKKLENKIEKCVKKFGHLKVNLTTSESTNGEGIWAVPCTKKDNELANNTDKSGEKFNVYACNQPVTWYGKNWGDVIVATNGGSNRPYARLADNEEATHDRLTEARVKKELWS